MNVFLNCLLVAAGAAVMAGCIWRSRDFMRGSDHLPTESRASIRRMVVFHRTLMVFFFIGYLVVLTAFALKLSFVGEFFTSVIFFFGAIFVHIAVNIQRRMVKELENTLHGLLPICSHCKKIRFADADPNRQESWAPVERYFTEKTDVHFSHGICPACAEEWTRD